MTSFVGLIRSSRQPDLDEILAALPGVRRSHLGIDLLGSVGGRGLLWHAESISSLEVIQGTLERSEVDANIVEVVKLVDQNTGDGSIGPCILRTLLLVVRPDVEWRVVERFERDLARMPRHVPGIVNWRLSRVRGRGPFTHSWEQEYRAVEDLRVGYMVSPYHWGWVDRWFDPEHPECIVESRLAHVFVNAAESVLDSQPSSSQRVARSPLS